MLDLYQSGAFPRKLLNIVLTNLLLKVYIILIMKRFTSSFSINQTPKINDLIISINENKKILFNTEQQSFLHREKNCLLYTSPSPRDRTRSRMPSSA